MIQLTDEYKKVAQEYRKVFGYSVPLSMIPPTTDMPTLIDNIKKCISQKEDILLDLFEIECNENDLF